MQQSFDAAIMGYPSCGGATSTPSSSGTRQRGNPAVRELPTATPEWKRAHEDADKCRTLLGGGGLALQLLRAPEALGEHRDGGALPASSRVRRWCREGPLEDRPGDDTTIDAADGSELNSLEAFVAASLASSARHPEALASVNVGMTAGNNQAISSEQHRGTRGTTRTLKLTSIHGGGVCRRCLVLRHGSGRYGGRAWRETRALAVPPSCTPTVEAPPNGGVGDPARATVDLDHALAPAAGRTARRTTVFDEDVVELAAVPIEVDGRRRARTRESLSPWFITHGPARVRRGPPLASARSRI